MLIFQRFENVPAEHQLMFKKLWPYTDFDVCYEWFLIADSADLDACKGLHYTLKGHWMDVRYDESEFTKETTPKFYACSG